MVITASSTDVGLHTTSPPAYRETLGEKALFGADQAEHLHAAGAELPLGDHSEEREGTAKRQLFSEGSVKSEDREEGIRKKR